MGIYGHTFDKFKLTEEESLLLEDQMGSNDDMCIYTYKQDTRELYGKPDNAYVEVYNNKRRSKATEMIRIVLGEPYYRDHKGQLKLWEDFGSKEKKSFVKLLNSPCTNKDSKFKGLTVYQAALKYYGIDTNYKMPDYVNDLIAEPSSNQKKKMKGKQ